MIPATFNLEGFAADLYTAYCVAVGGLSFSGEVLPRAEVFFADPSKQKQADAWRAVAKKAVEEFLTLDDR